MSDPRSQRIAELRAEMAREQHAEKRAEMEVKMKEHLTTGVVKAISKVEETLEMQIKQLEEIENMGDEELEVLREQRLRRAKQAAEKAEQLKMHGHGEYRSVTTEKEFFAEVKGSAMVVAHFGRSATPRCEIVDGHLVKLARRHIGTKFLRVEAERVPYLADKLKIIVLPSIVLIKNNHTEHTLVGFEEFGGVDDFPTAIIEKVLFQYGVVSSCSEDAPSTRLTKGVKAVRKGGAHMDDWED